MKTQNPWMGRARGSAGNMTSSKVYDKNVMRAKAFEVNNPNTAAQQTERNFFKQCQDAIAGVSEEQLRSLFPNMPKNKSRRNALMSQVLKIYETEGNEKFLYPSKLESLGNGKKQEIPIIPGTDGADAVADFTNVYQQIKSQPENKRVYVVGFHTSDEGQIQLMIIYSQWTVEEIGDGMLCSELGIPSNGTFTGYLTTAYNQETSTTLPLGQAKLYSPS